MKVHVRLFANLRRYAPGGKGAFQLELSSGATIRLLLENLKVSPGLKLVILVNGHHANQHTELADGDAVTLYQPVGGG